MAKRSINTNIEQLLVSNKPFEYAHLIKFERPFSPKDGEFRTDAKRYVYLTDGQRDITFDGNTYIANRILTVGGYAETTEARATNMSLTLSGEPIGLSYTVTAALSSSGTTGTLTGDTSTNVDGHVIDFVEAGFIEGDSVKIEKANGTNFSDGDSSKIFVIEKFSNENRTFTFKRTGTDSDDSAFVTLSNSSLKITLDSAEIRGPLVDTGGTSPSFLNREVFIHKVFFDADDPSTILGNSSVLVFKGIISSTNIQEAPNSSKVQWNLTSHWGDFEAVQGRITTDEIHRALDGTGRANNEATIRPAYARDLGFLHAETSLNTLATYQTSETRYKYKTKKKMFGFRTKIKEVPYEHITDHDVDLSVFLSGKYLPVVYGVQRVAGIPVFADTDVNDPKQVYVVYALSEGENHGLYNLYVDGASLLCVDKADSDVRSTATAGSDVQSLQCYGRIDRGDTLSGAAPSSSSRATVDLCEDILNNSSEPTEREWARFEECMESIYDVTSEPTNEVTADDDAFGIQHEEFATISHPYGMHMGFFSGRPDQKADQTLVTKAVNNGFKRQSDYYTGEARYWSPDHRLLDTCYVTQKFTIDADQTTVPEVEYVVRGKVLENYNYDGTFVYDTVLGSSDNHTNFLEGDSVKVQVLDSGTWKYLKSDGTTSTTEADGETFRILDKYNLETARGTAHYRFRLDNVPNLNFTNGVPGWKSLRLADGTNYWHMITYNNNLVDGENWSTISADNTISATSITVSNNALVFTLNDSNETKLQSFYSGITNTSSSTAFVQFSGSGITGDFAGLEKTVRQARLNTTTNEVTISSLVYEGSNTPSNISLTPSTVFDFSDISSIASITNTAEIVGTMLQIVETGEEREIIAFNTTTNMATISSPFVNPPQSSHTFNIVGRGSDKRASINPAIQTTDILTNKRYGKGLKIDDDIDLSTVKTAALLCDTRSDVTLYSNSVVTVKAGDIYKLTKGDGTHLASGKVSADVTSGTAIKFEEVSGKFLRSYQDYIDYSVGDIVYNTVSDVLRYYRVTTAGYKTTEPTHLSGTTNGFEYLSTPALTKVSGNANSPSSITLATNGNIPLYSLFDSDFVRYWRYLGWEENRQWCVTRHQTNGTMDTAKSVFSNINTMLSQFNGILSYSNGKYELGVETAATAPTSSNSFNSVNYDWNVNPEYIEESDIIGTINLNDNSQKNSKNTVKGSIFDPQNNFQSRSITFYNSDFLKADRNVIKTGNMTLPAVSSYYNARMTIEKYLLESRFSKEISFTVGPKGLLLKPGQVISVTYAPFDFSSKLFRISNINYLSNCNASIKATEYDDSFYVITPQRASKAQQATLSQRDGTVAPGTPTLNNPSTTKPGIITLTWTNASNFKEASDSTQIWRASSQGSSGAVSDHATLITTVDNSTTWSDAVGEAGTFYYWIRHIRKHKRKSDNATAILNGSFNPAITAGKQGVAKVPSPQLDVDVASIQIKFNDSGALTPSGTAQNVKLTATLRNITPDSNGVVFTLVDADQTSQTDVQFTNDSTTLTDTSSPYEATVKASSANDATTNKFVKVTTTDTNGEVFTELVPISITKDGSSGSTGIAAAAVKLEPSKHVITYSANDPDNEDPTATITFTTELQGNTGDATSAFSGSPFYEFLVDGTTIGSILSSGNRTIDSTSYAFNAFALPEANEPADGETREIKVKVRDGSTTGDVKATDSVTVFGLKSGSDAITAFLTNSAHVVAANNDGSLDSGALDNAGGTFKVFVGTTDKTQNCTFSEVANEETGITSSIAANTGVYSVTAVSSDLGSNVFRATIPAAHSPTGVETTVDQTYSISKSKKGNTGASGADGRSVRLLADDYSIVYDEDGSNPSPTGTVTDFLTAEAQNFDSPEYRFTIPGVNGGNPSSYSSDNTFNYTIPTSLFNTPKTMKVEVRETQNTSIIASDTVSVYAVKSGTNAYTVILDNEAHAIPADKDGNNPVLTGSGCTIEVYKGSTELNGITSGTPTTGQFKVTVSSDTNITAGSQTSTGNPVVFADHSSLTSSTANIVYSINIENTQTILKKQSFTRVDKGDTGDPGDNAQTIRLSATSQIFELAKDGTTTPSSITFTASRQNISNSTTFTSSPSVTLGGSGDTATLSSTNFGNNTAVTVTATAGSFSDDITVVKVEEGTDAITGILGNESHTFQANNAGTVSDFSGGTTTIQVFEGATALDFQVDNGVATSAGEFTMTRSLSGITAPSVANYSGDGTTTCTTGTPTAMSGDSATITYTITGKRANGTAFSFSKVQSFAKSKTGADGSDGDSVKLLKIYLQKLYSQSQPSTPTDDSYNFSNDTLTINSTNTTTGWTETLPTFALGYVIYECEKIVSGASTDTNVTVDWPAPSVYNPFFDLSPDAYIRLSSTPGTPTSGTANPPTGNPSSQTWSSTIPSGSDDLYVSNGTGSWGASGLSYTWSAPAKVTGDTGGTGQSVKTVELFKKNDSTFSTTTAGSFSNPTSGVESGWTTTQPDPTNPGDKIYMVRRTFTSDAASPQDSSWSSPVIVAQLGDGVPRSAKTFIYHATSGTTPSDTTTGTPYNFETGVFTVPTSPSGWSTTRPSRPYFMSQVDIAESSFDGNQDVDYNAAMRIGAIGSRDAGDFEISFDTVNSQIKLDIDTYSNTAGLDIADITDTGNTKTYAGYAGTGLDASGRLKTSIISGSDIVSVADLKNTKVRTFNAIDSSNRVIGSLYDGTVVRTPAQMIDGRDRSVNAIDSSNRLVGDIFDGTNTRSVDKITGAIANDGNIVGTKVPLDASFLEVASGNIKIKNDAITGDQLNDSITYSGTITAGSGSNSAHLDGTGTIRIYAGATTANKSTAPFRVTQGGALTATSTTLGSTSGIALDVSSGTRHVQINTPSSSGLVFQAGGDASTSYIPLKITTDGTNATGVLKAFDIYTSDGTKIFDKDTGLTDAAITTVAAATGSAVSTVSKTTNSENADDSQKITNGSSSQTVTVKAFKDGTGMVGFDTGSLSNATADIPSQIVFTLKKSANADLSSPTTLATKTINRGGTTSNAGGTDNSTTFIITTEVESEPGFTMYFVSVEATHNDVVFNSDGDLELSATDTLSADQTVYYFTTISGTGGNGAGSNNRTSTASRTVTVTAASGNTFTIDESGDSTGSTAEGDITEVVAGSGLTGGASSGSATLNVIGGDGITANANDIEVDSTVIRTTGNQTLGGTKTFSSDVSLGNGTGLIGEEGGDSLFIQGGTTSGSGLVFHGTGGKVLPARNSASIDATINLGQSSRRFKDLYLSGNIDVDGIIDNTYNNGNVSPPSTSDHTAGTRIKFYDGSATAFYAIGVESNHLWYNADQGFKWYEDAVERMTLSTGGNLSVDGSISTGSFTLPNSSGTSGQVLKWPSSGTTLVWSDDSTGSGSGLPSGMTYASSILDVTGQIRATGDVTAFYSSDKRFKDNVTVIDNAIEKVSQIRGVEFDWNELSEYKEFGHDIGVIAQEVEKVVPEIVIDRDDGYKAVNYQKLTALLIEAVKELKQEIEELKNNK